MKANKAVPKQALSKHGSALSNTENYIPGQSPPDLLSSHSLGVYWKQDLPSDPWSHTFHSCTSEASPQGTALLVALGSSTADQWNNQEGQEISD